MDNTLIKVLFGINLLGSPLVVNVPNLQFEIYTTTDSHDPYSDHSPHLTKDSIMDVTISAYRLAGLKNGGPFNMTATAQTVSPPTEQILSDLSSMIGRYCKITAASCLKIIKL